MSASRAPRSPRFQARSSAVGLAGGSGMESILAGQAAPFHGRFPPVRRVECAAALRRRKEHVMRALGTSSTFRIVVACTAWLIAARSTASAQTLASGKWEIELYGGGMLPTSPAGGTVSLPPPGQTFTTSGIYPPPAPQVV